jgi:hypothetical protein
MCLTGIGGNVLQNSLVMSSLRRSMLFSRESSSLEVIERSSRASRTYSTNIVTAWSHPRAVATKVTDDVKMHNSSGVM